MREHIMEGIKVAKRLGGKATYRPNTPHGRLDLEAPDGRHECMIVSHSPRCMAQATRIMKRRIQKFMEGRATCAHAAIHSGEKP